MLHKLISVGAGPNNLSVFSLAKKVNSEAMLLLEKNSSIKWHHGMMLDDATLQNNIVKDLVTLADPTSEYSILNYLHEKKRIYEFISHNKRLYRQEYNDYLCWVADKLKNVSFNTEVTSVRCKGSYYELITKDKIYKSENICLGIGRKEFIPKVFDGEANSKILFHSSQYNSNKEYLHGLDILIVGGGQSAAEIFLDITRGDIKPKSITWVSRRYNFLQINESPFDNNLYTPSYVSFFTKLRKESKLDLLGKQRMTSDGINPDTLDELYGYFYKNKFVSRNKLEINIELSSEVTGFAKIHNELKTIITNTITNEKKEIATNAVILCTGYCQNVIPDILKGIKLTTDEYGDLIYSDDYSVNENNQGKIYLINSGVNYFGINDPNISLCAWRASQVVNSIYKKEIYVTPQFFGRTL